MSGNQPLMVKLRLMRGTNEVVFTASPVDLAFGSSAELRSVEVYASNDDVKNSLEISQSLGESNERRLIF